MNLRADDPPWDDDDPDAWDWPEDGGPSDDDTGDYEEQPGEDDECHS